MDKKRYKLEIFKISKYHKSTKEQKHFKLKGL